MGSVSGTASAMRGCGSPRRHRNLGPCGERWHSAIRGAARTRPAGSCTARRAIRAGPEPVPGEGSLPRGNDPQRVAGIGRDPPTLPRVRCTDRWRSSREIVLVVRVARARIGLWIGFGSADKSGAFPMPAVAASGPGTRPVRERPARSHASPTWSP